MLCIKWTLIALLFFFVAVRNLFAYFVLVCFFFLMSWPCVRCHYFFLSRLFFLLHVLTVFPLCRVFLYLNIFSQTLSVYRRGGQPAAREPHAALRPVSCGSFSHTVFLLSAASFCNHVAFANA